MRVDVDVFAPLHHALEDGHETLEPFDAHRLLLRRRRAERHGVLTLRDAGKVVGEALEDVGGGQVAVVVDEDVDDALRICNKTTTQLTLLARKTHAI